METKQDLVVQNAALKDRVEMLNSIIDLKRQQLTNSMAGLAAGLSHQDNIASFIPLFTSNLYAPLSINYTLLTYLYKTHGILQTMIDEPVLDAFRDGLELTSRELDATDLGELEDYIEDKGILETVKNTIIWGRLYGGSGLVINVGQDTEKPFDDKAVRKGMLELYDANRWELSGTKRTADSFLFYGHKLDASRVITFGGKRAPHLIRAQLAGWGMSELERATEDFNMFLRGRNVLYEILDESKVDIYKIEGYREALVTAEGTEAIRQRVQHTNSIKNFHNAILLDKNDEYEVKQIAFSGLAEVMQQNRIGIASALRMPLTKIFGMSSAGFSTGEDDIENYNAMVTSQVREPAKPLIRRVLRLAMLAVYGREYDISFKFKPLRIIGSVEQETINTSKQTRYQSLYTAGLLNSKEIGELLHKDGLVPIQTEAQQGLLPPHPTVTADDGPISAQEGQEGLGEPKAPDIAPQAATPAPQADKLPQEPAVDAAMPTPGIRPTGAPNEKQHPPLV